MHRSAQLSINYTQSAIFTDVVLDAGRVSLRPSFMAGSAQRRSWLAVRRPIGRDASCQPFEVRAGVDWPERRERGAATRRDSRPDVYWSAYPCHERSTVSCELSIKAKCKVREWNAVSAFGLQTIRAGHATTGNERHQSKLVYRRLFACTVWACWKTLAASLIWMFHWAPKLLCTVPVGPGKGQ